MGKIVINVACNMESIIGQFVHPVVELEIEYKGEREELLV